ncbi:LVIVD repeat-containing protein [Neotamlana laminarinivorans]|uniref:LVIVD repeat-containing protein n=1 Tax=Neotamlana laminarinivorans TaxID=2883124 RepID=A0A9X1I3J0_9FLAO|nr:hypothetical protein [Tamlana laminarinivorans]MCB4799329.1 hypothetical protein [Tamlana laminarinivorans]
MKTKLILCFVAICPFFSCDDNYEVVQVATPQLISKTEFRNSVTVQEPHIIQEAGKIYAYKDLIFVGDIDGIHVIDNSIPETPVLVKFIKIPVNEDISVKDDYLYADSATDLLVFDISDINNEVSLVERLEDVFTIYDYNFPEEADEADYSKYNYEEDIIVGWTVATERRKKQDDLMFTDFANNAVESTTGTGGSLARFQIVNDYLYTVGSYEMSIFNISNLSQPVLTNTNYAGWNIETMFQKDNYLYLGSTNGMYIYSLGNPSAPEYISEFTHWESCDPVVVDGDYAYLTLRGGNACGQLESVLEVIDVSDKANPTLASRYTLENPYGLGIKGNMLFVCDGTAGLKLFNKENPLDLSMVKDYNNIQSKDVIPLENSLLMIGGNTLYQYKYLEDDINLISTFQLN